MASALQLNAAADIINGQGLAPNPRVLNAIADFQKLPNVQAVKKLFDTVSTLSVHNICKWITTVSLTHCYKIYIEGAMI